MKIFSHRGLCIDYPENSFKALDLALSEGFCVETDVRFNKDKQLIMSHDPEPNNSNAKDTLRFGEFLELVKSYEGTNLAALHIKEPYNQELMEKVLGQIAENTSEEKIFIFDMNKELLKPLKKKFPAVKIGLSVAEERYTPILYFLEEVINYNLVDIIWADQWQKGLYSSDFFKTIAQAGKKSYVISAELHQNLSIDECKNTWEDLISWGVDGICTDYPRELLSYMKGRAK